MSSESTLHTAYHEAGHAVISYRFDFYIDKATIIPDGANETLGSSTGEHLQGDGSTDVDYIVSLFAGGAAQRRFDPSTGDDGCGDDDEKATELLELQSGISEAELRRRADELVAKHWQEICAVATALNRDKTLSSDEIEMIVIAIEEGLDWKHELKKFRRIQLFVKGVPSLHSMELSGFCIGLSGYGVFSGQFG